jgi:hypothetical protein
MATPNRTEYLDIDGLPLATPAWEVTNLFELWGSADQRGDNDIIPFRRGRTPRRHHMDSKRRTLQMVIEGGVDSDGNPAVDARQQLEDNISELKLGLRPLQHVEGGVRTATLHTPNRVLVGPSQIRTGLQLGPIGPAAVNATLDVEFTDGVLYDVANEVDVTESNVPGGGSADLAVPNPGDADQFHVRIDLTGTATQVQLTNLTWDPDLNAYLVFGGALEDTGVGTTIDTETFTAVRNGISVIGLVSHSGHEFWLPLVAGTTNTIRIEPTGGTATVRIRHYPAFA